MSRVSRPRPPTQLPRHMSDRPSRLRLLLRRQRRLLRPAAWGLAGFLLVLGGIVVSHSTRPGGTLAGWRERLGALTAMRVQEVVVQGRANTPEPLLRAALGVSRGDPILGFSPAAARERIETLTWIEHASVERRLPGTVVVSLAERRPFAIWQHEGRFVLIDRAGQVVADQDVASFGSLPLVVGGGAPPAAAALLDALSAQPSVRSRVVAAVRVAQRRWNLRMNNGTDVLLPEGAEAAALNRLAELQAREALLDRPLAAVDMRLPDRLVVRPQPAPPAPPPPAGPRRPT